MQASVAAELEQRLDLYKRAFELCRQGGFSLARLLALVPDRLALAVGEGARGVRVPVWIPAAAAADLFATPRGSTPREAPASLPELKRVLRLAQLDADLDPRWVHALIQGPGEGILRRLAGIYRQGFGEVGRGEGGTEAAYLVHLALLERVGAHATGPAEERAPQAALWAALLDLAIRTASEAREASADPLSLRLALQLALSLSPLALFPDVEDVVRRPVNAYRTSGAMLALARRVVLDPVEGLPLARAANALAERALADPEHRALLCRDALVELCRDLIMLAVLEASPRQELRPLPGLVAGWRPLLQAVQNQRRREELRQELEAPRFQKSRALEMLRTLLGRAEAILAGDADALSVYARIEERARLSANGALLAALDQHASESLAPVFRLLQVLAEDEGEEAFRQGRAYRLGGDEAPLFRLRRSRREAHLLLRWAGAPPGADKRTRRRAERVEEELARPLLDRAARTAGVRLERRESSALVLSGDLRALFDLLRGAQRTSSELGADAAEAVPDVLGGGSALFAEAVRERQQLELRRQRLEAALQRPGAERGDAAFLEDELALLGERLARLEEVRAERQAELAGAQVEASLYLTLGEALEDGAEESTSLERVSAELERATDRSPWLARELARRLAGARRERPAVVPAFRVAVEDRHRLDLPADLAGALDRALGGSGAGDGRGRRAAESGLLFSRWLKGVVEQELDAPQRIRERLAVEVEVSNTGAAVSGAALEAWLRAKSGLLVAEEHRVQAKDRPALLLSREEERLLVVSSAADGRRVVVLRWVGELGVDGRKVGLWELLPERAPLLPLEGGG